MGSVCFMISTWLCRLLKGRSIPGKVLLTRRSDPFDDSTWQDRSPKYERSLSENDSGPSDHMDKSSGVLLKSVDVCGFHV